MSHLGLVSMMFYESYVSFYTNRYREIGSHKTEIVIKASYQTSRICHRHIMSRSTVIYTQCIARFVFPQVIIQNIEIVSKKSVTRFTRE